MHAHICYYACMVKNAIQYTVRIDDPGLDRAVRRLAKKNNKSINETVILTLSKATGYAKNVNKPAWAKYSGNIPFCAAEDEALASQRQLYMADWQ